MTIQLLFHLSGIRTFKKFYTDYVCKQLLYLFPGLVSYNRFTELGVQMIVPLAIPMTANLWIIKGFMFKLFGKLCEDKGYISKTLFEGLFHQGIHLVTKLQKNMKTNLVTPLSDAILLRKRAICGTIIYQPKNIFQIEHSCHRNPKNFLTNLFSALIAYNFTEKKPSLKTTFTDTKQLMLF